MNLLIEHVCVCLSRYLGAYQCDVIHFLFTYSQCYLEPH